MSKVNDPTWRILHITDLHISDPDNGNEFLRRGRFKEYIDGLFESLNAGLNPTIATVFATGDFVHKGTTVGFPHAKIVLEHILIQAHVDAKSAVVCIGNHDVVNSLEEIGKHDEARNAYYEFSSNFANKSCRLKNIHEKAVLCKLPNQIWALSIDSTIGGTAGEPGALSDEEIDTIAGWVYDLPSTDLLVVTTHYPAVISQDSVADYIEKDPDYHRKHEWRQGKPLRERIRAMRRRNKAPVLWLSGDIHLPEHICVEPGQFFVTTGRFGTSTPEADSAILRQAKLIDVERATGTAIVLTATFQAQGHEEHCHLGRWQTQKSQMRMVAKEVAANTDEIPKVLPSVLPNAMPKLSTDTPVTLIDDGGLDTRILEVIAHHDLYTIGRFHTSDDYASLAWISIGPLLNEPGILPSIISRMAAWLRRKAEEKSLQPKEIVLLGIDCWGAVLASQLSVITGSPNFCLGARGAGKYSTSHEAVSDSVCKRVAESKLVVLVSDVVATGRTMAWVHEQLITKIKSSPIWWALCIIADRAQDRSRHLSFLEDFGVACGNLRMPIVSTDAIPDERILPTRLSFAHG